MSVLTVTSDNYKQDVLLAGGPVLVDFWAPWCVYCRRIAPALERIAEKYEGRLTVAKINVDDCPDIAAEHGVVTIPALFLFENGQPGEKLVAPTAQAEIEGWLDAQL